jgi:hypothetical protein
MRDVSFLVTGIIAGLAQVSFASGAFAQANGLDSCWIISPADPNAIPWAPILLDRCNGKTWILAKVPLSDGKNPSSAYAYRWRPLSIDNGDEPLFRERALPTQVLPMAPQNQQSR